MAPECLQDEWCPLRKDKRITDRERDRHTHIHILHHSGLKNLKANQLAGFGMKRELKTL